ncbi:Glycerophosphocholine phosphodiesterase, partial [Dimargaris verticillata]
MAARHGHLAVLKVLTDSSLSTQAKPEINKAEKYSGWTPLIMAAQEGYLACVQHLLAVHADPNVLDHTGWNAHERAAYCGHCQVAEVLRPLSRPPIEALMQLKASKPLVSPGQPASQSSEGKAAELKSDANLSFIERTYGHTYLQNQALLVLTMGSNDTTDQTTPVNLRSDLFDVIFNTVSPATALSLVISADTAMDLPTTLDLPLDGHTRLEPIQLLCSLDRDVTVQIDLVPTYGDRSQLLGRAVASLPMNALSTHIPTSAAGCEKVQVTLLSTPALQPLGTIQFEYLLIKPYAHRNVPVETRAMYWKSLKTKIIGHRGSGMNHDTTGGSHLQVGENT